jgi:hypothetical protein
MSILSCLCLDILFDCLFLALYISLSVFARVPVSGCRCLDTFPPYIWLYTFSSLNLAVYIWLSMLGCVQYVCLSLLGFCCLAVNICPAVFYLSVNVWLAMTGCRQLAFYIWPSLSGCLFIYDFLHWLSMWYENDSTLHSIEKFTFQSLYYHSNVHTGHLLHVLRGAAALASWRLII